MKKKNKYRFEVKLGFFVLVLFGLSHTLVMASEIVRGFLATLSIALIVIGFLSDNSYEQLKKKKKKILTN
ncbi:hypothetical protein [uncultured Vagococcus sp.]|uniref:hypothetical protein n=1 Tax=uncultured Vagococcus sp. TaxID=189676 RepID=UPI0028D0AB03|nr:hypothetical protein [uncultured Vagococcus sp.]